MVVGKSLNKIRTFKSTRPHLRFVTDKQKQNKNKKLISLCYFCSCDVTGKLNELQEEK